LLAELYPNVKRMVLPHLDELEGLPYIT